MIIAGCGQSDTITAREPARESLTTWQEQYDLGMRYLTEGSFEEAIIAFTLAIEIDPMQVDAYEGLADAYIRSGDTDMALKTLQQGYSTTNSDILLKRIDELNAPDETEEEACKDVSEEFTVSGLVAKQEDYFAEEYTALQQQYAPGIITQGTIFVFDNPVTFMENGKPITIDGAILATNPMREYVGQHVIITGHFFKQSEKFQRRVYGPYRDEGADYDIYSFNPVGPYLLSPSEITAD